MAVGRYIADLAEAITSSNTFDDAVRSVAMRMQGLDPSDWRMSHRPPSNLEEGAPLSDLTGIYPEDVYTNPRIYASSPEEIAIARIASSVRDNPDAMIDMYRAVPRWSSSIETGDWVTPSYQYARQHADLIRRPYNPTVILRGKSRAADLLSEGNSLAEYGYIGPTISPAARLSAPRIPRALVERATSGDEEALSQLARLYGLDAIARDRGIV